MRCSRKRFSTLFLALVVVVNIVGLIAVRVRRHQRLDVALIAAIARNDAPEVERLIKQGASPNAHANGIDSRNLLHRILDALRGKASPGQRSALHIAISNDIQILQSQQESSDIRRKPTPPEPNIVGETIIRLLLQNGASLDPETPADREAEKSSRQLVDEMLSQRTLPEPWYSLDRNEKLLASRVGAWDGSVAAMEGVSECRFQTGDYAGAAHWSHIAWMVRPSETRAHQGMQLAQAYLERKHDIEAQLPYGYHVQYVRPYPSYIAGEENLWAATYTGGVGGPQVGMYQVTKTGMRCLDTAKKLVHGDVDAEDTGEIQLAVTKISGDSTPLILTHSIFLGASWAPSRLSVFTLRSGKLVRLMQADGGEPLEITDLRHDGHWQVQATYEIGGSGMSHAEQPRWTDIYTYKIGRFVLSNEDYPDEFTHWLKDFKVTLHDYPGDKEILDHLELVRRITSGRATTRD